MKKAETGSFVDEVVRALGGRLLVATLTSPPVSPTTVRKAIKDNRVQHAGLCLAMAESYARKAGGSKWGLACRLAGRKE